MIQSYNATKVTAKTDANLMFRRSENAKKNEGSKDVCAEASGHHKASTSTNQQVNDRLKNLCGELAANCDSSVYRDKAPLAIENLVQTFW